MNGSDRLGSFVTRLVGSQDKPRIVHPDALVVPATNRCIGPWVCRTVTAPVVDTYSHRSPFMPCR